VNLLIDIGNSRIKWCLYNSVENEFGSEGAMHHDKAELPALFSEQWGLLDNPDRVVISNVSGQQLAESMDAWVDKKWQMKSEYVKTEAFSHGVSNAYSDYQELGVDRWMAIIAAWQRFRKRLWYCYDNRWHIGIWSTSGRIYYSWVLSHARNAYKQYL